ncbi:uncharacterized protein [Nicotiana sylvestris]|uniref:uncharacterized protein n=1 Tax=Nicotiana sylvestris TaxID=4096 RepID=UPI00388CC1BF
MEDIFKIKQGDSEFLREFMDRFQGERMTLPRVLDNWVAIAFTSNLNEKSSEATSRLKESLREFPATTWNDVYNNEKGKQAYMKNRQEPPKPPSPKRIVNVISGAEDINGVTYTAANKVSKVTITHGKRVRHVLEEESIMFDNADADVVLSPHNDALVISLLVHDTNVKRVLIDPGSSVNIILLRVLCEMQAEDKLIPKAHTLSGFDNFSVVMKGEVILTTFAEGVVKDTKFQVVDMEMAYNMILGRPWIHEMDVVPSTLHQMKKTSFITDRGTYCYEVMPFGLKNVSATYQRLVTKMFQEHLGKTVEVYIDDMLVKTQHSGDHISHLSDTFKILPKFNMKLNPEKCAFGVASVNPAQIKAIEEIPDMLTTLKKQDQFEWTEECQQALKNLKTYLSNPSLLAKPKLGNDCSSTLLSPNQGMQFEAEKELQVFNGSNLGIWTLFTNGSSNVKGAGLGIVLVPPTGETIRQAIKCHSITNNEAEYEAVIAVNQMLGTYTAREARMQQYLEKVQDLIRQFQTWKVMQIPKDENVEVDALANLAFAADVASNENASVIHLFHLVLDPDKNEVNFNNLTWDWRCEIVAFLQYGTVPEDKKKVHVLRKKAARYCLKQGNLYRKMFGGPLTRCLGPSRTEYVMRKYTRGIVGITPEEDHW